MTYQKSSFNTQPPEGGWSLSSLTLMLWALFQHTAARRRLDSVCFQLDIPITVSTHSRPKAAGRRPACKALLLPPFQHTAARRRLVVKGLMDEEFNRVSTHSRPKAAGKKSANVGH